MNRGEVDTGCGPDVVSLTVAVITEVFVGPDAADRLGGVLERARSTGAVLAVLPELPLNPWSPASKTARDRDAEPPGGPRHRIQADAARAAGIGLVGGAIVRDPETGTRHNTALVFDTEGNLAGSYRKLHLPDEEGFWEADHYRPGADLPRVIETFGLPLGLQICSDVNRPALTQVLGALGAELIVAPRATPRSSYERWKLVLRANAITCGAYVISTNRPGPESGVDIGGPSIVIAPDGSVLLESEETLHSVVLDRDAVRHARMEYPGYLDVRAGLYARAWSAVTGHKKRD